jgi:hypothetical protein
MWGEINTFFAYDNHFAMQNLSKSPSDIDLKLNSLSGIVVVAQCFKICATVIVGNGLSKVGSGVL